jgi:hypothetical protein
LFVKNSSFRRLVKNQHDYIRLLREATLVSGRDTAGLKLDSIYSSARVAWIGAALKADSLAPAPAQSVWTQQGGRPAVSVATASWIIAASRVGLGVAGSARLSYPLIKYAREAGAVIVLEYPHEYQWLSRIRLTPAQAYCTRSDGTALTLFADGRSLGSGDSLRQCIVLFNNADRVCPFVNSLLPYTGAAPVFAYPRYLREYAAAAAGTGANLHLLAFAAADTLPCLTRNAHPVPE